MGSKLVHPSERTSSVAETGAPGGTAPPPRDFFLRTELSGAVLLLARAIVVGYAFVLLLVYLRWLPGWLNEQSAMAATAARFSGGGFPYTEVALAAAGVAILSALAWTVLAVLVFWRRTGDLFGLLLSASFLSSGILFTDFGGMMGMLQTDPWAPWPATVLLLASALSLPWAYVFPDGRFVPRWTIPLAAIWVVWNMGFAIGGPSAYDTTLGRRGPTVVTVTLVASAAASFVYRYWRRSTAVQRQQLKWLVLGGLVFFAVYVLLVPSGALVRQATPSSQAFLFQTLHSAIFSLAVIAIPVALGIAIFRQGLLDIDLIINRTLTYGAITAVLVIVLVTISGVSNWALEAVTGQRSEFVLLASVVPVALVFMPVRARVLTLADRFVSENKVITLLFVDLVGSTERAYALGDRAWRDLLEHFRSTVRRCLKRYGGKEVDTAGDGFFVTFESPGQAVRCAREIVASVRPLDLEVRVGVHIGEVQVDRSHVEGGNVHLASRVMSAAGPGEVLRVARAPRRCRRLGHRTKRPRYPEAQGCPRRGAPIRSTCLGFGRLPLQVRVVGDQ